MDNQNVSEVIEDEKLTREEKKKLRIEQEVQRIHNNLASGNLNTLISKVAYILNNYKDTRNSDMILKIKYWEIFQNVTGNTIDIKDMFKLERDTQIARARAKVQNEYKLFQADEKIRWYRKDREETEKEIQISNKPSHPSLTIFADESGKSGADKYLIIGGLWVLDHNRVHELQSHFRKWKSDRMEMKLPKEYHFTEMKRQQLDAYKDIFTELLSLSDMISLKAVVTERSTNKYKTLDEMIYAMFYQHVHHGVEHERSTGRISLPRAVNFWKDKEEGNDKLFLQELEQHLVTNFSGYFKDELTLDLLSPIDSFASHLIQMADLYTGCINRYLNPPKDGARNHKDEFADFVFDLLNIDPLNLKDQNNDMAMIHYL